MKIVFSKNKKIPYFLLISVVNTRGFYKKQKINFQKIVVVQKSQADSSVF
jgi:hypothetical protein